MIVRFRYLLVSLVVGGAMLIAFGCSQKDDIIQPQSLASITLRPQNLPTLDTAYYVYELWMVAVDNDTQDSSFTSLGRFIWDNYEYSFKDMDGNKIGSVYEVPSAWFSYDYIMLSVENRHNDNPEPSGSFILVDEVGDPAASPISLQFPISLFDALGYYFVATPTDNNLNQTNEKKGLWICSRAPSEFSNWDTLGVYSSNLRVYPVADPQPEDSVKPDTVGIVWPVDSIWEVIDTEVVFSYDTAFHRRIQLEWVIDTVPDFNYQLDVYYQIDSMCALGQPYPECAHLGTHYYWDYTGPMEEMPDIKPYGWRYCAWVLLEDQPAGENYGLGLNRVVPFGFEGQQNYSGDTTWVVLPLGAFFRPDSADLSNQYLSNLEVPNYPGEDFVIGAPAQFDNLNLRLRTTEDATGGEFGSIVIGLEPIPGANMTIDDTRNFPLAFMIDFLPYYEEGSNLVPEFHNYSQFLPEIDVIVEFHE